MSRKAIGYIRVSTSKQEQFGGSIEAQKDRILLYGRMYGLEIVDFLEDASSAKSIRNRPAMLDLISRCRGGEAEAFVCCKIDRMFRNTIEGLQTADEFTALGVSMYFVDMGGLEADVTTARGRRIFAYELIDAEAERMRTGERTREVLGHKRENGRQHSATAPYGWRYDKSGERHEVATEQEVLHAIFLLRERDTDLGPTSIANALSRSEEGFKTRSGKRTWQPSTVRNILHNPLTRQQFEQWTMEVSHAQ